MLMSLISMLGGGLMRMLPELIVYFNKKADNSHELNMLDKQIELEKLKAVGAQQQADNEQILAMMNAQVEAVKGQMQLTGIKIVDGLNMLVRPLTTYYFLALFGIYKAALLAVALQQTTIWQAILQVYTPDDAAMLSGILAFWFVGRTFEKKK